MGVFHLFAGGLSIEELYLQNHRTFAEAEANLSRFIADVYNGKCLHSNLGYRPPVEIEERARGDRTR
jgi:hypothetical protein